MSSPIYLYNTLHKRKEPFTPLQPPEVGLYSCGPTVYDHLHIGNLRAFLFADLLKRVLLANGYQVTHIMNITDVGHLVSDADEGEDKMEKGAKREGLTAWDIAERYTQIFFADIDALNILPATIYPKATEHIEDQIALVKKLEEKGFTYIIDDGVYFDTSKFPTYGQLGELDLEHLQEGARVTKNEQKKNASDFALWKFSPKDSQRDMEWDSPWGKGFPGWHLECSAMSMKYLGMTFDIHTGGVDHKTVHHPNEIAQSEAATDKPFVKFWLHNEFLALPGDEKMSKSKGDFLPLESIVEKGFHPLDYRFATMLAHYRSHLAFSWTSMEAAREGRERVNQFARRIYAMRELVIEKSNEKYLSDKEDAFFAAVNDDLNAPEALAILFEVIKEMNTQIANKTVSISPNSIWDWLMKLDSILGLRLKEIVEASEDIPEQVQQLLSQRQLARENRDYEASDRIRDQIRDLGYIVEDNSDGQSVHPV